MRTQWFGVLGLLAACGGVEIMADPEGADASPTEGTVTVDAVTRDPEGAPPVPPAYFTLRLRVSNHTGARAYVYAQTLDLGWSNDTKVLTLVMHEAPPAPLPPTLVLLDCHLTSPQNAELPAGETRDVDVRVPRVRQRFVGTVSGVQRIDDLLGTAKEVHVELGWSDRQLQFTIAQGESSMCQAQGDLWLESLERGIAVGSFPLAP